MPKIYQQLRKVEVIWESCHRTFSLWYLLNCSHLDFRHVYNFHSRLKKHLLFYTFTTVILILKCIFGLRKIFQCGKIDIMECKWQILYCSNMACIQYQFSFQRSLLNLLKFEIDLVCEVIIIIKCILRLRNTIKHTKKGIMRIEGIYLNLITSGQLSSVQDNRYLFPIFV